VADGDESGLGKDVILVAITLSGISESLKKIRDSIENARFIFSKRCYGVKFFHI